MSPCVEWDDLKRRCWMHAVLETYKLHSIVILSVIIVKVVFSYILRTFVTLDFSFAVNYKNILFSVLPCYVFLFFLCLSIFSTYQVKAGSNIVMELYGVAGVLASTFCAISIAKALAADYPCNSHLFCIFMTLLILKIRLRRQGLDKVQLLDRESICAPYIRTLLSAAIFQALVSFIISIVIWNFIKFLLFVAVKLGLIRVLRNPYYSMRLRMFMQHGSSSWSQLVLMLLATTWVICLTESFYEVINRHITHLDAIIANSLVDFNCQNHEERVLIGRCLYNYCKGISLKINISKRQFEACPPSFNVSNEDMEDPRRCSMEPFAPFPVKNSHFLEPKRHRYHVDPVVYKMLIDNNGTLFTALVEACVVTLLDLQSRLQYMIRGVKGSSMTSGRIYYSQQAAPNFSRMFVNLWEDRDSTNKTLDTATVSILYLRATVQWLYVANMLGYNNTQVQEIAKEVIIQAIAICRTISVINRTKIPVQLSMLLDTLSNVALSSIKNLTVYNEAMTYSTFDTDFDTFRLVEKLFKPPTNQVV